MKTEMKVLLYLKRNEQSEKDMCPLMGRISIKGRYNSTAQFSCKMKVDSKIWHATSQRCTGKSKVATSTNREIEKLLLLLRYRFNEFLEDGQKFSAEDLKNAFQGIAAVQMTLLKLFKSHNEELALCVGVNRTQNTYLIYDKVYRGLEKYIHRKKKVSDVPLKQLDMMFIEEYDLYLKIGCKYKPATRIAYLKVLKKLMNMATCRGLVPSNPFKGFKSERPKQTKRYLEMDELKKVMTVELDHPSDILARDLFVFSALTGVCYCDMRMLTDSKGTAFAPHSPMRGDALYMHLADEDNEELFAKMEAQVKINYENLFTRLQGFSFFITEEQLKTLPLKFRSGSAKRLLDIMRQLRSPLYPMFP